mgnify:CR=1 FL=1
MIDVVGYSVEDNSDIEKSVVDAAKKHFKDGNYDSAIKLYLGLLKTSASARLYFDVGLCYYKKSDYDSAIEYLTMAANLDVRNSFAYSYLGNCYFKKLDAKNAIENWTIARSLSPKDEFVCLNLAMAYFVKCMGWFNVNLPAHEATETVTMEGYNPLVTIINAVPSNIFTAFSSNNSILAVVVVALILGLSMTALGEKTEPLKNVLQNLNDVVQLFLNFLIDKIGPMAIFCMISRTLSVYGIEYIKPTLVWILTTIVVSLVLVTTIYPVGIFLSTRLNPVLFMKKAAKIGLFAAATNSSAATLPLNTKTCTEELGCTPEISSFVLPTGMTINMNGTTAMHMVAITFIATAAGIDIKPSTLVVAAFLSICTAMGTPAIPVAGTTMVYVVMTGLGMSSELCMIGYSLVLAMNYLPGMAVITLNVIGDAATNVIVNFKEGVLDKEKYNKVEK